mgnify:CR=1 FL=1
MPGSASGSTRSRWWWAAEGHGEHTSNEEAVAAFLAGEIRWVQIAAVLEEALERHDGTQATDLDVVIEVDRRARHEARRIIETIETRRTVHP